jgi:hypothetical protein
MVYYSALSTNTGRGVLGELKSESVDLGGSVYLADGKHQSVIGYIKTFILVYTLWYMVYYKCRKELVGSI